MNSSHRPHFPLWLLCLLLFAVFVFLAVIRIPLILERNTIPSPVPFEAEQPQNEITGDDPSASESPLEESLSSESSESEISSQDSTEKIKNAESPSLSVQEPEVGNRYDSNSIQTPLATASGYGVPDWGHIHRYKDGICSICGEKPVFYTGFLPHEFYAESEYAGSVQLHEYEIPAYANGYGTYQKRFNIYLPYGYDETKPYNVLMLIHGGSGNEDSWLNTVYPYKDEGIQMSGRTILDNMFAQGICDPCIVVCPVTEIPQCQGLFASTNQLKQELREYILPYIVDNYSTYAANSSIAAIQAARDHFALGGLSNGALFVYEGGMRYNFDLFGSYAAFSGNGEPWETVSKLHGNSEWQKLPFNCYFTGAGTENDWQQNYTKIGYEYFLEHEPVRLAEGKNAWRVDVEGGHEWKVWFTDLFNCLPLLFPS